MQAISNISEAIENLKDFRACKNLDFYGCEAQLRKHPKPTANKIFDFVAEKTSFSTVLEAIENLKNFRASKAYGFGSRQKNFQFFWACKIIDFASFHNL